MDFFLADDLSGALDAAGAFHHAGRRVKIVLSLEAWTGEGSGDDVVGVTTETRNAAPGAAAAAVTRAIAHGRARDGRLVYKKIDSTLRGPVAAELAALAAAMPEARILFTPANPLVGRTVRGGVLLVRGVPVAETEFARDPVWPVKESAIRNVLGEIAPGRLSIADAETEDDLVAAVARMDAMGSPWVAVGSGALARPVAARNQRERAASTTEGGAVPAGPVLMLCGSAHPGNREQARLLSEQRGVALHELRVASPQAGRDAAAHSIRSHGSATLMIEQQRGDSAAVVNAIAATAAELVAAHGVRRIFATGGETAFALCAAVGISTLAFRAELEPGMSVAHAHSRHGPLALAIKPGGFGDAATWVRAWDSLRTP